jgi:hypothetical protein
MENPRSLLPILGLTNLGRTLLGEKGTKSPVGLPWTWARFWTVNNHQLSGRLGRRCDVRPAERVFSITSATPGLVRPCPSLWHKFRHYRSIPNTVGTRADRTSPLLSLRSFRSPVSQTLELVYGQRSDENSSATSPWTGTRAATRPARDKICQDGHRSTSTMRHASHYTYV